MYTKNFKGDFNMLEFYWFWKKISTLRSSFPDSSLVLLTKDYTEPGDPEGCRQFLKKDERFFLVQSGLYKHDDRDNQLVDNIEWCEIVVPSISCEECPNEMVKAEDLCLIPERDFGLFQEEDFDDFE